MSKMGISGTALCIGIPMSVIVVIILCLQVMRFIIITNLNRMKLVAWNGENAVVNPNMYRFHRFMTSDKTFVVTTLIVFVVQSIIAAVLIALIHTSILTEAIAQIVMISQGCAFAVVAVLIAAIVVIWGLIKEGKDEGFSNFFSTVRDPLLFRLDFALLVTLAPFTLSAITFQILQTLPSVQAVPVRFLVILICTRVSLFFMGILMTLLSGGTCMIAIIYKKLFGKKKIAGHSSTTLVDLLEGRDSARDVFGVWLQYCKGEFCSENILAYMEVQKFNACTNNLERHELATKIYTTYLTVGAIAEVNVPKGLSEQIHSVLATGVNGSVDSLSDIFVDFERELIMNMMDTFSRFSQTSEYKSMEQKRVLQRKEMVKHNLV